MHQGSGRDAASKDVQEAFRATCFAADVPSLAAMMGTSPGVLYNKANTSDSAHHKPTLADAVLVQLLTGDKRVTHAMARLMGGVFVELPRVHGFADQALLDLVAGWMKEQGELFAAFQAAYADGALDARDMKKLQREAYDVLQAVLCFVQRLEGIAR